MIKQIEIKLRPADLGNEELLRQRVLKQLRCRPEELTELRVRRRSIDARGRHPFFRLQIQAFLQEQPAAEPAILDQYEMVDEAPPVIIVGAGPAGMFAALELIELGLKPIIPDIGYDLR